MTHLVASQGHNPLSQGTLPPIYQTVPTTHLNVRDILFREWHSTPQSNDRLRIQLARSFMKHCESKVNQVIDKLKLSGPKEDKARPIFAKLILREAYSKWMIEQQFYDLKSNPQKPGNNFYFVVDAPNERFNTVIKDKTFMGRVCHSEKHIYRIAWLLGVEDNFLPTGVMTIRNPVNNPSKPPFVKVGFQPTMNQGKYAPFDVAEWSQRIPQTSYIQALMVEMILLLGDSFDPNLRRRNDKIVHFDLECALLARNDLTLEQMYPIFNTDLLRLEQSFTSLNDEHFEFIWNLTMQFCEKFPAAVDYFRSFYPKFDAKERAIPQSDEIVKLRMDSIIDAWVARLYKMVNALDEIKKGNIRNMLEYVLYCFPSRKALLCARLGLAELQNRIAQPPKEIDVRNCMENFSLRHILRMYAGSGIPFHIYAQVVTAEMFNKPLFDFQNACRSLPPFEFQRPITLYRQYEEEADRLVNILGLLQ